MIDRTKDRTARAEAGEWPFAEGPVARSARALDWSGTALGPRSEWPAWQAFILAHVLGSTQPMAVALGPDRVAVGNDGLALLTGDADVPLADRGLDALPDGAAIDAVMAGGTPSGPSQALLPSRRPIGTSLAPVRDEDGRVRGVLIVYAEHAERGALPTGDERHRLRNMLSMIRTIARRSREGVGSLDRYLMRFDGRLDALARTQTILAERPEGVGLWELAAEELLSVGLRDADGATLDGPPVRLTPKASEVMALALHELALNAVEHGALVEGGGIELRWSVGEDGELAIEWTEERTGPPPPGDGDRRNGFGHDVVEGMVAYELDARTRIELTPTALRCRIALPPGTFVEADEAA